MLDRRKWTPSALLLTMTGIVVVGIGIYFVLFRPPLLPEDVRYMQLTEGDLSAVGPSLRDWLGFVFAVLGGFVMGTGILMMTLAATAYRSRRAHSSVRCHTWRRGFDWNDDSRQFRDQLRLQVGTAWSLRPLGREFDRLLV